MFLEQLCFLLFIDNRKCLTYTVCIAWSGRGSGPSTARKYRRMDATMIRKPAQSFVVCVLLILMPTGGLLQGAGITLDGWYTSGYDSVEEFINSSEFALTIEWVKIGIFKLASALRINFTQNANPESGWSNKIGSTLDGVILKINPGIVNGWSQLAFSMRATYQYFTVNETKFVLARGYGDILDWVPYLHWGANGDWLNMVKDGRNTGFGLPFNTWGGWKIRSEDEGSFLNCYFEQGFKWTSLGIVDVVSYVGYKLSTSDRPEQNFNNCMTYIGGPLSFRMEPTIFGPENWFKLEVGGEIGWLDYFDDSTTQYKDGVIWQIYLKVGLNISIQEDKSYQNR